MEPDASMLVHTIFLLQQ